MKKILLSGRGRLGDILAITNGVKALKEQYPDYLIKVDTTNKEVWQNNPYLSDYEGEPDLVIDSLLGEVTQRSKINGLHINQGCRLTLEKKLGIKINQTSLIPDLYLTQEEKNNRKFKDKYWIINTEYGNEVSETKKWVEERWQEVIDKLPFISFVQTGISPLGGIQLKGSNIIDYRGKTKNLRELFSLFYNCEGVICLIGGNAHLAAAFKKPCVVIAGSNEPVTFEAYSFHRYLSNIGSLSCSELNGCWKCRLNGCKNVVNGIPKCKEMITSDDVVKAVMSYYDGGKLKMDKEVNINLNKKEIFRIVANANSWGGAERSCSEIMKMANERGLKVEYASINSPCYEWIENNKFAERVKKISSPCDYFLFYASDMVFSLDKPEFDVFNRLQAKKKFIAATYKRGKLGEVDWTKNGWEYIFLSSELKNKVLERIPDTKTYVLAPPINVEKFLEITPNYDNLNIIRYSSQGDTKFAKTFNEDLDKIINVRQDAIFHFMPAPSFITPRDNVIIYGYNSMNVDIFLKKGNLFYYSLPIGYTDQGSRVICESMYSGIPVIADACSGALDRITEDTGWLCKNKEEFVNIIKNLTLEEIKIKGQNARQRAIKEFDGNNWVKLILK